MITAGFVIHNPLTQSRTTVLASDAETNGQGWLLEVACAPGQRADIPEHWHQTWTETFEIVSGTAHYRLDGQTRLAQAGEKFVVQPTHRHTHPWAAGPEPMVYRQSNQFAQPNPQAVQDVLGVFATVAGLARLGQVNPDGRAKNPLQLAAALKVLTRHGGYDASLPIAAQNVLAATLGTLAEALGYKGVDPRFV